MNFDFSAWFSLTTTWQPLSFLLFPGPFHCFGSKFDFDNRILCLKEKNYMYACSKGPKSKSLCKNENLNMIWRSKIKSIWLFISNVNKEISFAHWFSVSILVIDYYFKVKKTLRTSVFHSWYFVKWFYHRIVFSFIPLFRETYFTIDYVLLRAW